jgi:hypothetical protein
MVATNFRSMEYLLDDLLHIIVAERAEALHLVDGRRPVLELREVLHTIEGPNLAVEDTEVYLEQIAPDGVLSGFSLKDLVSFDYAFARFGVSFLVMAFRENVRVRLEFRRSNYASDGEFTEETQA